MPTLVETLNTLASAPNQTDIRRMAKGIEKESLRITPEGTLAMTPHPKALGAALTHPHITTDYSEALLEFITEPHERSSDSLQQLHDLHVYTYQHINDEQLWVSSMPCMLGDDKDIPIAQYGTSNSGTMKSVYREGLGHRYGRSMQTIAGIHYNFSVSDALWEYLKTSENSPLSLQDFKTQGYFRLIRNFRRYFWLLLYLFGASPGLCKSFLRDQKHNLHPFGDDAHSLHAPFATSLRMGDLGYQSNAQDSLVITYNCLDSYLKTLCCAITQTHPEYAKKGVQDNEGHYQQLNDSLLQIENEFYSVIRPKRTAKRGETALSALANGGIEYIEVRCLDLNPYEPIGISEQQSVFLDTFLMHCLLSDSPMSDEQEYADIQENQKRMVYSGRDPEITLLNQGKEVNMREWGQSLFDELEKVGAFLDQKTDDQETDTNNTAETLTTTPRHLDSVHAERQKMNDAALTPSARILADMKAQNLTFYRFAANKSLEHKAFFDKISLGDKAPYFEKMAADSLIKQEILDKEDTLSFSEYLADYYSQYQCVTPPVNPDDKI